MPTAKTSPIAVRTPGHLDDLLSPLDADSFLAQDWGKCFRYVEGRQGKFSALLPWAVLNQILEQHRLEPPRLRLTREGRSVPPETYLSRQPSARKNGQPIPRLNSTALTRELREGSTLVLDNVDELHHPITHLADALEGVFRVRIQVNAYAGWRTSHGFDLHWDGHDVFILQVAGRKHWKVYGMTRPYPLTRDVEPAVDPPSEVLWEGLLKDGDLLYIPRGWWHVATPLDEPTLHLTVGVHSPTGADLLTWYVDRLRAAECVRRDLPFLSGARDQTEFANRLHDAFLQQWRPELIEEYLADTDAKRRPRARFCLPWSATGDVLPTDGYRIRWNGSCSIPTSQNGEITIKAHGRQWRFDNAARPLLEKLMSGDEHTLHDLETAASALDPSVVQAFVKELVIDGLVVLR